MTKGNGDPSFGRRESDLSGELFSTMVDSIVNMAKVRHEWNHVVDLLTSRGAERRGDECRDDASGERRRPARLRNLSFELAEIGVYGWRDLLELQKRFQPELLAAQMGPGLAWLDPAAELVPSAPVLRLVNGPSADAAAAAASATFTIENRSSGTVELLLPRVLELSRADGSDRVLLDVEFIPALPVLGPGDLVELEMKVKVPAAQFLEPDERHRYIGAVALRTRFALRVELPVELIRWPVPPPGDEGG